MAQNKARHADLLHELDALLDSKTNPALDLGAITADMDAHELADIAAECEGDTAQTVADLIEGVLLRDGGKLSAASIAALESIRTYHVPTLQDALRSAEGGRYAD